MSLIKQLWLAIGVLILLIFVSGFIVSGYTARSYYVEQLTVKNIDNATGLALSLSQMDKDPVMLELMISAQFDTGHYQRIELIGAEGQSIVARQFEDTLSLAPTWFGRLMAFDIAPGVALVQDGWNQFGTLYVESQSAYALAHLWRVSYQLLAWFLGIALVCGVLGSLLLRRISHPLQDVVAQAEAIGERRFITSSEPRTLEFMRLVRAMNTLTARVQGMLEAEAQRLDDMRRQSLLDPSTGVANREQFCSVLDSRLGQEDKSAQDAVLLLRITALAELNQKNSRAKTDIFIKAMIDRAEQELNDHRNQFSDLSVGRLNGSDFAFMLTNTDALPDLANRVWTTLNNLAVDMQTGVDHPFVLIGSYFWHNTTRGNLFSRLDDLLAKAEISSPSQAMLADNPKSAPLFRDTEAWRNALTEAIENRRISITTYPTYRMTGTVFHDEAMLRIELAGQRLSAGSVIGWARRLGLLPAFDLQVLQCVLKALQANTEARIAVNLSAETLVNSTRYLEILERVQAVDPSVLHRLSFEVDEGIVVNESSVFTLFATAMKSRGVGIGLQAAGNNFPAISGLEKLGLDYLKVDGALIHQYHKKDTQNLLRGLCKLGHSLGLVMIAEGVQAGDDKKMLMELDFDAVAGPGAAAITQQT